MQLLYINILEIKLKFVNIKRFAKFKGCSRQTIYAAERRGEIDINRDAGFPVVYLTKKNLAWKPGQKVGRPRKKD